MSDILNKIIQRKHEEVAQKQSLTSLEELQVLAAKSSAQGIRGFRKALEEKVLAQEPAIIAELKKASPSKGLIRADFDVQILAQAYARGKATCLSVLTDRDFFQGDDAYLKEVRALVDLPLLRKDFLVTPYQVYESKVLGADAILLIVAALDDANFQNLFQIARSLHLDVLIEVHSVEEYLRIEKYVPDAVLGVNNRNLRTFEVDLETTKIVFERVKQAQPNAWLVTESGIHKKEEILLMQQQGIYGFLVGESLMRYDDPAEGLRDLFF